MVLLPSAGMNTGVSNGRNAGMNTGVSYGRGLLISCLNEESRDSYPFIKVTERGLHTSTQHIRSHSNTTRNALHIADGKYFGTILRCTHTTGPSTFDPKSAVWKLWALPWYTMSSGMVGRGFHMYKHGCTTCIWHITDTTCPLDNNGGLGSRWSNADANWVRVPYCADSGTTCFRNRAMLHDEVKPCSSPMTRVNHAQVWLCVEPEWD